MLVQNSRIARAQRPVLTPQLLIAAYSHGLFPMARSRGARGVEWYSPDPRAILPLESFHVPRGLRNTLRKRPFEVRTDTAFERVVEGCALPRAVQRQSWINKPIRDAMAALHTMGHAHSVEAWLDGRLVGGLYGASLGGAFFGESMFHRADLGGTDASKVCLHHLVERMRAGGYKLLDIQLMSEHMKQFGAVEVSRAEYLLRLSDALGSPGRWG